MTISLEQELFAAHQIRQNLNELQKEHGFVIPRIYDSLDIFEGILYVIKHSRSGERVAELIESNIVELIHDVKADWRNNDLNGRVKVDFWEDDVTMDEIHGLIYEKVDLLVDRKETEFLANQG